MSNKRSPNDNPYLTVPEVAKIARFDVTAPADPVRACRQWLEREAVPVLRRGRVLLIERAVLEAILRRE